MPDDEDALVDGHVRAVNPHLMDREAEQEPLAGKRQCRPDLQAQLTVHERSDVELRARWQLGDRGLSGVALPLQPFHQLLVGGNLVRGRELAPLVPGGIQIGDSSLSGIPAFFEDASIGLLIRQPLGEPAFGDLIEQRVAQFQSCELRSESASHLVVQAIG